MCLFTKLVFKKIVFYISFLKLLFGKKFFLSKFNYLTIHFSFKNNFFFSDGSLILPEQQPPSIRHLKDSNPYFPASHIFPTSHVKAPLKNGLFQHRKENSLFQHCLSDNPTLETEYFEKLERAMNLQADASRLW